MTLRAEDFIPTTRCWLCERDCDDLAWEAVWFDDGVDALALHPVCPTCLKEKNL